MRNNYKTINELRNAILTGAMQPPPEDFAVCGSSYIYQTTKLPGAPIIYKNYYLFLDARRGLFWCLLPCGGPTENEDCRTTIRLESSGCNL